MMCRGSQIIEYPRVKYKSIPTHMMCRGGQIIDDPPVKYKSIPTRMMCRRKKCYIEYPFDTPSSS